MENKFYIYAHYRKTTGEIFYIGKGFGKRAWDRGKKRTLHWHNVVKKNGYTISILHDNLTENEAFTLEKELIKYYGRNDLGLGPLVNMTDGGEGASGIVVSQETKEKQSLAKKGVLPWNYKKKGVYSQKSKEKIRIAGLVRASQPDYVNPMLNKNHTEETIQKQRECKIGKYDNENNPNSKIVLDTQTGIFYMTMKEYAEVCNISSSYLGSMLRGDRKNKTNGIYV